MTPFEGIAIGVSFAHLETSTPLRILGLTIPLLAVAMTLTSSRV